MIRQDSHGREWHSYLHRIFWHVVIFLALGPILGDLILFSLMSAIKPSVYVNISQAIREVFLIIPFAYLFGGFAAAFTGFVIGGLSLWVAKAKWLFLIAIVTGGVSSIANFAIVASLIPENDVTMTFFLTGTGSAIICTALTRRFRVNNNDASNQAAPHPNVAA